MDFGGGAARAMGNQGENVDVMSWYEFFALWVGRLSVRWGPSEASIQDGEESRHETCFLYTTTTGCTSLTCWCHVCCWPLFRCFALAWIVDWILFYRYMEIPVISRLYLTGAFLTTAACAVDLISPFTLYFNWNLVYNEGQIWRLITPYLFFGVFSVDFLFHMYFLVRTTFERYLLPLWWLMKDENDITPKIRRFGRQVTTVVSIVLVFARVL